MNKHRVFVVAFALLALLQPGIVLSDPWDRHIDNPNRFHVLAGFGGNAVLDRETDLVWERAPDTIQFEWLQAQALCNLKNVGNRKGWRLPTVQELASLVDPTVPSPGPTLPSGHPFQNIRVTPDPSVSPSASAYWSATSSSVDSTAAWDVEFQTGVVANTSKSVFHYVWCVRGGQGVDIQ